MGISEVVQDGNAYELNKRLGRDDPSDPPRPNSISERLTRYVFACRIMEDKDSVDVFGGKRE